MARENVMTRSTMTALSTAVIATVIATGSTAAQDRPFRSMAVEDGQGTLCELPKPPVELRPTNGHREAYEYWLEKLELERRLETGECDCQVDEITWEEVGEKALPWHEDTAVGPGTKRRAILSEIEVLQARVQEECAG